MEEYNKEEDEDNDIYNLVHIKEGLELNSINETGTIFEVSESEKPLDDLESCYSYDTSETNNPDGNNLFSAENQESINNFIDNSFEELSKDFVSLTEDNLVMKQLVKPSIGGSIPPQSSVTVHYCAYLEYSPEPFDSTRLRGKPLTFDLGTYSTIEGFEIAVASMKKKEISKFLICPEYAYGPRGCPPRIPPEAICFYIIEVIDFFAPGDSKNEYFSLPAKERVYASFEVMMQGYDHIRNTAKRYFHAERFHLAAKSYSRALSVLLDHHLQDEDEENQLKSELAKVHTNLALCHLKLRQSARAIHHCNEVFKVQGDDNIKALYFKGKALRQLGEFKRALRYLEKANTIKPGKKEILTELEKASRNYKIFSECILNCGDDDENISFCCGESEFKTSIERSIKSFQADNEIMELPLPSFHFKTEQIKILKEVAAKHDLLVKETESTNGTSIIYVYKKF